MQSQSVIFIFEHSESGSAGLILNKPTEHTIGSIDGLESLCPEFADNCLFMVGRVSNHATVDVLVSAPVRQHWMLYP